ncbi:MAG: 1,2-phenylacetyl-CoA epoxidase, subunit B (EC [Candidatus Burkholderia crenata]|nr:MAG: 1,2-phenylacetyl-CoA epoxidase, subunit B (EC [Candidatus Burkholderia crenata]
MNSEWPIWEVFVCSKQGLDHKHCGSLHAPDAPATLRMARDVYTRRQEGVSIWVVPLAAITVSDPADKAEFFEPAGDKIYRHATFFVLLDEINHMRSKGQAHDDVPTSCPTYCASPITPRSSDSATARGADTARCSRKISRWPISASI